LFPVFITLTQPKLSLSDENRERKSSQTLKIVWVKIWVCRSVDFVLQESNFSVWSLYFDRNQRRPLPTQARSDSTSGFSWSTVGLELRHPIWSGRLWVRHKLNPDRPMDSPSYGIVGVIQPKTQKGSPQSLILFFN